MPESKLEQEMAALAETQEAEQDSLMACENVVGLGIGNKIKEGRETGDPCLSVFVSQKLDTALLSKDDLIKTKAGKFKTDVVETGVIFAGVEGIEDATLPEEELRSEEAVGIELLKARVRPVEGGYSVGHYRITAGTYATAVYDAASFPGIPQRYYVLSNNHVLANSNNARIGDPIVQPGPFDGGRPPRDTIARLSRFVPIRFGSRAINYVDAAIAEGPFDSLDREIYWIGYVGGIATARVGTTVQKTGRTTNFTTGRVTAINATVNVNYGGGGVARFVRQIVTSNMSAGGDSGSLLLDMDRNALGLLFAGSSAITIHCDLRYVQHLLGIRIA